MSDVMYNDFSDWKKRAAECIEHNEKVIKGFFFDTRWLSNFYNSPVVYAGNLYKTSEHAYQAAKTVEGLLDEETIKSINNLSAAGVKGYGGKVALRDDWESVKYDIMAAITFDKFYRHDGREIENLRQRLLDTGDRYLEETNYWHDNYWGYCICAKCKGKGQNNLGKILMKTREFWK